MQETNVPHEELEDHSSKEKTKLFLPKFCLIPLEARQDPNLPDSAKIYLGELNVLTNKFGYCYASDEQLAEMKGVSIPTIERWNAKLEKQKFIRRETKKVHYTIKGKSGVFIRTVRKVWVIEEPSKENSNKDADPSKEYSKKDPDPSKMMGRSDPSKMMGRSDPSKMMGITEEPLNTEYINNNELQASPVVVVFSCFDNLKICSELKEKLSLELDEEKANQLVKRVLRWKSRSDDSKACNTILSNWETWSDEATEKEKADEKQIKANEQKEIIDDRRARSIEILLKYPSLGPSLQLCVTDSHIEQISNKRYAPTQIVNYTDKRFESYFLHLEREGQKLQQTG